VLAGEGKDCDPDKLGALSPQRIAALTGNQNCTNGSCVAALHTLSSLTFASEEAADVFRYRVSLSNNAAAEELLKIQEPDPDNPVGGGGGGPVSVDGYHFPMAPRTQRDYGRLPCTPERFTATAQNNTGGVCHHDGTGALDLFFGPDGTTDGLPVYAITDGIVLNINPYPRSNPVPGCYAINFKSSLDDYHYWYGHLQNPRIGLAGQTVTGGTQIAEVARNSLGDRCRGGRDHLHIDRGCTKESLGGSVGCRDPGFVDVMNNLWNGLPPDTGRD
jgi:murein DD-endopeptidase MepM/ murein hydrolase activator NlpD